MNVHYFQHVPFEGLGTIEKWLLENGHHISTTKFYEDKYQIPSLNEIDALIIMGGPMSVNDVRDHPWLHEEKEYIKDAIHAGKKILGICLGAQLIAAGCGAVVGPAPHKEIGWFPIYPTAEGAHINWIREFLHENPVALHWHGEQFQIPAGAYNLAYSDANTNQAFLLNDHVLGLQFHLEMTKQALDEITVQCASELIEDTFVQSKTAITHAADKIAEANKRMNWLLTNFLK